MPLEDLLGEKSAFGVIAPEPLVVEEVGETGYLDLFEVRFQGPHVHEVPDRGGESVALDKVGAHRPVHETPGFQAEPLSFAAKIPGILDGDELRGQPVSVFFPTVRESTGGQSDRKR